MERAKHLECWKARLWGVPAKQIAAKMGVTRQTVHNWVRLAEGYDDPTAVALREVSRHRSA